MGFCNCAVFCYTLLFVPSSFAIILMGKRELVAMLSMSSWCLVIVVWLFLVVPWVYLQFVIVVFPDHTHYFLYREKHGKIILSETIRPRALIFGMYYHLVDLYQVCSNYTPGTKNGPTRGNMFYIGLYREKYEKIFLSETTRPRGLIFGMKHHLVNLYQVCSIYISLGPKMAHPGVTCFT